MDPLTHTLLGANLASTRLRDTTRLATAALVIGANLPDVDSILYYIGQQDLALGFRRGWTHGVLALAVLPFLQTALLLLYDRLRRSGWRLAVDGWRTEAETRRRRDAPTANRQPPTANPKWLLALSFFAILTHPFLDWLNNYGMRWLMPFRETWFYGDSVFIMDPWLWLILGCGWLAPRAPSRWTLAIWAICSALLAFVVFAQARVYLPVVIAVALVLLGALVWRPRVRWIPSAALVLACAYIVMRLTMHGIAETRVARELAPQRLMISPHPFDPTRWEVVAQTGPVYRFGRYSFADGLALDPRTLPLPRPSREWDLARRDPSVRGFMSWVRFPWYEVHGTRVQIHDARYATRAGRGFGGVEVEVR